MKKFLLVGSLMIASSLTVVGADAAANWAKHCAQCHGKDGRADTKMGKQLKARDLSDPKVQAAFTDEAAAKAIKEGLKDDNGKTTMKAFGDKMTEEEVKALVAYTRTLKN